MNQGALARLASVACPACVLLCDQRRCFWAGPCLRERRSIAIVGWWLAPRARDRQQSRTMWLALALAALAALSFSPTAAGAAADVASRGTYAAALEDPPARNSEARAAGVCASSTCSCEGAHGARRLCGNTFCPSTQNTKRAWCAHPTQHPTQHPTPHPPETHPVLLLRSCRPALRSCPRIACEPRHRRRARARRPGHAARAARKGHGQHGQTDGRASRSGRARGGGGGKRRRRGGRRPRAPFGYHDGYNHYYDNYYYHDHDHNHPTHRDDDNDDNNDNNEGFYGSRHQRLFYQTLSAQRDPQRSHKGQRAHV